jgi:hypothetical protein
MTFISILLVDQEVMATDTRRGIAAQFSVLHVTTIRRDEDRQVPLFIARP